MFMALLVGPTAAASGTPRPTTRPDWELRPIEAVPIPTVSRPNWVRTPIDAFVLQQLEQHGLAPAPPVDRRTLIRRVYFDLLGLPPSPEEIDAFVADDHPDAFEHLVDRLLASPQYGERWGRHWLDVVRYADTEGFESDLVYDSAWKYRDYVIRSIAADKPFDRFVQEQVAGDELWPDDPGAVVATGMFCVGAALPEAAMMGGQLEYDWLTDSADTVGAAFLGLTMGCARCHDHKYDPITQADYYALQAFFGDTDRPYPQKILDLRIKGLNGLLSDAPIPEDKRHDPRCTLLTEKQAGGLHLYHRNAPLEVRRLQRGELSKPREVVSPAIPAVLRGNDSADSFSDLPNDQRRAGLARWLTSPDNPLVARVIVNRVWGWHFGQGLVRTPNDFGKQGEPPTHPELLDWLAHAFTHDCRWSLKRLHRLILLSSTYQMSSIAGQDGMQLDPEDRLLWHFPRNRLDGEEIRDAMLACAGTLNLKQFGPPVVPPLGSEELTGLFDAKSKWKVTKDTFEQTRRSVYVLERRTFLYPLFAAFDPPEVMTSCPRRLKTVVPTQALALLNSPLAREQSEAFAHRLVRECGQNTNAILARAWKLALGRTIKPEEIERSNEFLAKREAALAKNANGDSKDSTRIAALSDLCLALFNVNEFIDVD
jgi:hypothetical protein